jgi:uncharacterized spore protein YtfJ
MNEKPAPVTQPIEEMLERLSVNTVFGTPTREGDIIVIPVAEIGVGFGYGHGWGQSPGSVAKGAGEAAGPVEGGGGGGGGGGRARPVGYIRIAPEGVKFEPILDETRIALAGIILGAWSVFWISKAIRACARACASVFAAKRD